MYKYICIIYIYIHMYNIYVHILVSFDVVNMFPIQIINLVY